MLLEEAIEDGVITAVELALEAGAQATTLDVWVALCKEVESYPDNFILAAAELLVKHQGSIDSDCGDGSPRTLLDMAISQCRPELVRGLRAMHAQKRLRDKDCTSNETAGEIIKEWLAKQQ